ncbi:MAG: hypothetical protein ACFB50_13110 [Rubrobacteraceae bacterium]
MPELVCTARRIGDYESRTEEYELSYTVDGAYPHALKIKYQAARAYEINAALDDAVAVARKSIAEAGPESPGRPTDEALAKFSWQTIQSVKYDEGASKSSRLDF